jgi:chromosome segregation ATPase
MGSDENNSVNGWSEYGRLVLKELERLNEGQENIRKDMEAKFTELNEKMSDFKNTEKEVEELKNWRDKITEVWSPTQMKQSKDEIYKQKNQWAKVAGIIIALQILFTLILAFKDKF